MLIFEEQQQNTSILILSDAKALFPGFHLHKFPGYYFQCFKNLIRSVSGL